MPVNPKPDDVTFHAEKDSPSYDLRAPSSTATDQADNPPADRTLLDEWLRAGIPRLVRNGMNRDRWPVFSGGDVR